MLFHIKQSHGPQHCPYGKGGSTSLFDGDMKDVKIRGYWLAFPQHTTFLVVETDDVSHLQEFLKPGAAVTTCEITPVSDKPVPYPGQTSLTLKFAAPPTREGFGTCGEDGPDQQPGVVTQASRAAPGKGQRPKSSDEWLRGLGRATSDRTPARRVTRPRV